MVFVLIIKNLFDEVQGFKSLLLHLKNEFLVTHLVLCMAKAGVNFKY